MTGDSHVLRFFIYKYKSTLPFPRSEQLKLIIFQITGNGHEPMREDGELDRVEFGPDLFPELVPDLDSDVSLPSDCETTVRLNQDRAQLVHDDARPG